LGRIAADYGLSARARHYTPTSSEGSPVSFVVLGRTAGDLAAIDELEGWRRPRIGHELWTDEFSNLLSVLR
jgi:hypothetical protein